MRTTRRALLAAAGSTIAVGTAGCVGGIGGGGAGNCDLQEEEPVEQMPTPVVGDSEASVTVRAFEDFACPHCATYSLDVFPRVRDEYVEPGEIRYEFHDFPIPMNDWSWAAPSAARGVQDSMDDEAFFDFSHDLFENQSSYSMSLVQNLADDIGADGCDIRGDAEFVTYRPFLENAQQEASNMGLRGTPTVLVGDQQVEASYEAISSAIESRL